MIIIIIIIIMIIIIIIITRGTMTAPQVHKLQSNGDPGIVDCNAPLAAVLGEKRFKVCLNVP
jgi:hypothetical protein